MISRQKKLLFILVGVLFLGLLVAPYLGEARSLEVKYPKIPGIAQPLTSESSLSEYLSYLYYLIINIVGIAAFIILVIGGISYLTAAGSLEKTTKARKRIIGGSTGLFLVLGTVLILRTINPQLLTLVEPDISSLHGACLYSNYQQENEQVYCFTENTLKIFPEDFQPDTIKLCGLRSEFYQVFIFPEEDYQGEFLSIRNNNTSHDQDLSFVYAITSPKSIYFDNHESGVFLFPNEEADYDQDSFENFPNNLPVVLKTWVGDLGSFNDRTKSVQLRYTYHRYNIEHPGEGTINDWIENPIYPDVFYGVMLQEETSAMGRCAIAYKGGQGGETFNLPGVWPRWIKNLNDDFDIKPPGGINQVRTVQVWNRQIQGDLQGGVTFYDAIDTPDSVGHSYTVTADEIQNGDEPYFWQIDVPFDNGWLNNSTWHDMQQILSIKVQGNYWVFLNNKHDWKGGCSVFSASVPNLKDQYILQTTWIGSLAFRPKIRSIAIIPVVLPLE